MMPIELWMLGTAANVIISVAYLAIAFVVIRGLVRSHQLATNPLALATGMIFLSCSIGHGIHASHTLLPALGVDLSTGLAARLEAADWHSWAADAFTAVIAIWYWTLRGRFPALVRGSSIFEDMRTRQQQALEIHDNVVQGLAKAKLNFEVDRPEQGMREIEDTLDASRRIITHLLGDAGTELGMKPGQLRRRSAPQPDAEAGR